MCGTRRGTRCQRELIRSVDGLSDGLTDNENNKLNGDLTVCSSQPLTYSLARKPAIHPFPLSSFLFFIITHSFCIFSLSLSLLAPHHLPPLSNSFSSSPHSLITSDVPKTECYYLWSVLNCLPPSFLHGRASRHSPSQLNFCSAHPPSF